MSLSIKFMVNNTGKTSDVNECIAAGDCIEACDLNMTMPLSIAFKIEKDNTLIGLLHTLTFHSIDVY